MIYRYNEKSLCFYKLPLFKIIFLLILGIVLVSLVSLKAGQIIGQNNSIIEYSELERVIAIKDTDAFNKAEFIKMLKDLNIKHPHIVMAQSMIETGKWKSKVFIENHNLFGMKEAKRRISTAGGTQHNHAYYNHWRESVYDYAFYQCRYLHSIKSETEYFKYLAAGYAESPDYVNVIKNIIEKEKLKALFN